MPLTPWILDLAFPLLNETRPKLMPFYADYIIFQEADYYTLSCTQIAIVYFTSFFLYCGIDGAYVLTVNHTCGLFAVTW